MALENFWCTSWKRELFEERAETILLILKQRFPGLPQSQLDGSKIQFNRDVGQAILESYSRTIETMAFTVLSRIDDVIQADAIARDPSTAAIKRFSLKQNSTVSEQFPNAREEVEKWNASEVPSSMTLSDFMGWAMDQSEAEVKKDYEFPKEGNFKA
ncbi:hypothetical protein Leryth_006162 [Lithospermum erythrorhizon]|nr:hypothetical protein Leryth_006162 [Lithospermum erythrorhizon]